MAIPMTQIDNLSIKLSFFLNSYKLALYKPLQKKVLINQSLFYSYFKKL